MLKKFSCCLHHFQIFLPKKNPKNIPAFSKGDFGASLYHRNGIAKIYTFSYHSSLNS